MDCLQTKCMLIAHNIQTKCRLTAYFACIQIANLAHSHQLVVGPERPAVDKLRAVEVLVPNVKAAEDLSQACRDRFRLPWDPHAAPHASSAAELDF